MKKFIVIVALEIVGFCLAPRVSESSFMEVRHDTKQERYEKAKAAIEEVYHRCGCGTAYVEATERAAIDAEISPRLLAGLVFVESSCNPNAVSNSGSVGLTQVNPNVWPVKEAKLKDPEYNLRAGAAILSEYINRFGLVKGLHRYNGLNGSKQYARKVLTAAGIKEDYASRF